MDDAIAEENPFRLPFGYVCKSDIFHGKTIVVLGYYQNFDGSAVPVYGMAEQGINGIHHYDIEDVHNEEVV